MDLLRFGLATQRLTVLLRPLLVYKLVNHTRLYCLQDRIFQWTNRYLCRTTYFRYLKKSRLILIATNLLLLYQSRSCTNARGALALDKQKNVNKKRAMHCS
jgi:hypothetical protein